MRQVVTNMQKGDLVYIPAETTLFVKDNQGSIKKLMKLCQPANLLVVDMLNEEYKVLYENNEWLVKKNKTYGVRND